MVRNGRTLVGVDVGSTAIKAVELKEANGVRNVVTYGIESTPEGAIVDGTIEDPVAIAGALRRLFVRHRTHTRGVAASLSGGGVFLKAITVPVMTDVELAASIGWEVEQHIPLELEEVHFDYQLLAEPSAANDATKILLVAARRDKVAGLAAAIRAAGRRPAVVDVAALALQNVYEANHEIDPTAIVALVDAGARTITLHVVRGDRMLFSRSVIASGNVALDASTALDDFERTAPGRLERIVLTGGRSRSPGLEDALAAHSAVHVELLDPFRRIVFDHERFDVDRREARATAAVAVGLALRGRND